MKIRIKNFPKKLNAEKQAVRLISKRNDKISSVFLELVLSGAKESTGLAESSPTRVSQLTKDD
jgi:hypothetical protein